MDLLKIIDFILFELWLSFCIFFVIVILVHLTYRVYFSIFYFSFSNNTPTAPDQIYLEPSSKAAPNHSPANKPAPTAPPRKNHKNRLRISENLIRKAWFHGCLSRDEAEALIHIDGEFLVRESGGSKGQYVLTGMRNGTHRHLLLVDPEGKVCVGVISLLHKICLF